MNEILVELCGFSCCVPITRRGGGGGKVREVILGSRKDAINRCGSKKQNSLDNWPCKLCGRVRGGGWAVDD